jgi:hypothetical protein
MAFCIRGSPNCKGPYRRKKMMISKEDDYGTITYDWNGLYENREIGINYQNAT